MSLCQRADGRWIVRYKETDGTWKQKAFRDGKKARAFDAEKSDALENTDRLTVLECVVSFLRNVSHCERRIKTYKTLLLKGYAAELKDRFVDTLTRRDLELMREACRAGGIKPASINMYVGMLTAAFNWAAEQDFLVENPWKKYRSLPCRYKPRTGTLENVRKIFPFLRPWLQWATKTAIALCLRPGLAELFSLRWQAFRWDENCVEVFMPKVQETKIVYPPAAYMAEAAERRAAAQESDYVCPCPYKKPSYRYGIEWKDACIAAGVKPFSMYSLRHIAASQMIAAGADIAAVAAQLGHKNITTTGVFYTHAISGAQRKAGAFLDLVQK